MKPATEKAMKKQPIGYYVPSSKVREIFRDLGEKVENCRDDLGPHELEEALEDLMRHEKYSPAESP